MPLITIITVVFNAVSTIEKSILSVLDQQERNFEYIIIDGGSNDGTIDIINKYKDAINYFISEKDNGIYDAMNKAITIAQGKYLFFLGADDFIYSNDVFLNIENEIADNDYHLIAGNIIYTNNVIVKPSFNRKLLLHNSLHHQGVLYNSSLFNNFKYDTNFKLISDYELNLILFLKRKYTQILKLDIMISLCTDNGASRRMLKVFEYETNQIRLKHMPLYKARFFEALFSVKLKVWNAIRHN